MRSCSIPNVLTNPIGFDKIYYNPAKARLFCRRRRGEPLAVALAPPLEGNDPANPADAALEHREALFEHLADDTAHLTTRSLINAFADYDATSAAATAGAEPEKAKVSKASSKDRDLVTRRALGATLLNCAEAMIEVDLVGVLWKANNAIHTRCVDCGRHCLAHSAHQTNDGMTCGKHIHVECYPDYHRMWWVWNISRNEAERSLRPDSRLSFTCCVCPTRHGTMLLRTYDCRFKFFKVAMCQHHLDKCANLFDANKRPPPVRIDHLIAAALGYNKKMYM